MPVAPRRKSWMIVGLLICLYTTEKSWGFFPPSFDLNLGPIQVVPPPIVQPPVIMIPPPPTDSFSFPPRLPPTVSVEPPIVDPTIPPILTPEPSTVISLLLGMIGLFVWQQRFNCRIA